MDIAYLGIRVFAMTAGLAYIAMFQVTKTWSYFFSFYIMDILLFGDFIKYDHDLLRNYAYNDICYTIKLTIDKIYHSIKGDLFGNFIDFDPA